MLTTEKIDQFIEFSLSELRKKIEKTLEGETIFIYGPIDQGLDDAIRDNIEGLKKHRKCLGKLVVVIETPGRLLS